MITFDRDSKSYKHWKLDIKDDRATVLLDVSEKDGIRPGYELNLDRIFEEAVLNNVSIEINAHPSRLDLDWRHVKIARDHGVMLSINTDAHQLSGLDNLQYGIGIARKGWLRKSDVLNTVDTNAFLNFAKSKI